MLLTIDDPGLILALSNPDPLTPEHNVRIDGFLSVLPGIVEWSDEHR
jgi:hypothetical protein